MAYHEENSMIKTLTAIFIFSIIWFVVVVTLGHHFQAYLVQPERDMPLVYLGGNLSFAAGMFLMKWRSR
jgi:hypothetical protein